MTTFNVWVPEVEWRCYEVECETKEDAIPTLKHKLESEEMDWADYKDYIYDDDSSRYNIPWEVYN